MGRPSFWEDTLRRHLQDGRLVTHGELLELGLSKSGVARLVEKRVIAKTDQGFYTLPELDFANPFAMIAKKYGGDPDRPRGVICLRAAAHIHGLTDMDIHNIGKLEVAMASGGVKMPPKNMPIRILQWQSPYPEEHLEWHEFGGNGIYVTNPARTVCDLYAPWTRGISEGADREALGRLMARAPLESDKALRMANHFGWGRLMAHDFESMRAVFRFTEASEEEQEDMKGMTL